MDPSGRNQNTVGQLLSQEAGQRAKDDAVEVVGSTSLSWACVSRDVSDPAEVSHRVWQHAFRKAKSQLDTDLQQFSRELQSACDNSNSKDAFSSASTSVQTVQGADSDSSSRGSKQQLQRLLDLVRESLGLADADFQHSLPTIISWLHGERKSCSSSQAQLKSWYSRLLFLLSRCSRLLTDNTDSSAPISSSSNVLEGAGSSSRLLQGPLGLFPNSSQQSSGVSSSHASPRVLQLLGLKAPFVSTAGTFSSAAQHANASAPAAVLSAGAAAGAAACDSAGYAGSGSSSRPGPAQAGDASAAGSEAGSQGGSRAGSRQAVGRPHRTRRRSALVVCKTPRKEDDADLLIDECMLEGAPLIMRCNTMPVQQAEAMEQLLRQSRTAAAAGGLDVAPAPCFPIKPTARYAMDVAAQQCGGSSAEVLPSATAGASSSAQHWKAAGTAASAAATSSPTGSRRSSADSSSSDNSDGTRRRLSSSSGEQASSGAVQLQRPAVHRLGAQQQQQQQSLLTLLQQRKHQEQQKQQQRGSDSDSSIVTQQTDAQLSDFMAVHAAVSSDKAAPVHRSVSQLRIDQQHQQQQQQPLIQSRPYNQVDRFAEGAVSSGSSSPASSSCSGSSKGERGWLKQQWKKLSNKLDSKSTVSYSSRSSGMVLARTHGGKSIECWRRPSTAPGHLGMQLGAAAAAAATGDASSVGDSMAVAVAKGSVKTLPRKQQQQAQSAGDLPQVSKQQQLGPKASSAAAASAMPQQQGEAAVASAGATTSRAESQQQQQASAQTSSPAQQQERRASAFAGALPLVELWDPCEHPHASSIAAAAAARTVGLKLASSAAHFPYRSAPSSRAHSVDGSSEFGLIRSGLSRCVSPGGSPSPAAAGAAAAAAAIHMAGSPGHVVMQPSAAAALASGRQIVRMQPSRSSSQLSLDGLPMGGSSSGGRLSSSNLRHSASFTNLQVLRRQNSGLLNGGRRSSRLGGTSSARGLTVSSSGGGGSGSAAPAAAQFETSRLAPQQLLQQGTPSCRSSYDSLGTGSPVPSLAGLGLSRCATPLSMQTASASDTPRAAATAAAAVAVAGLSQGVFAHGTDVGAVPAYLAREGHSPMHQQPVFDGSPAGAAAVGCSSEGRMGAHAAILSLNTWANTPMGKQSSLSLNDTPQSDSPASRPSSPAIRQGGLLAHQAAAEAAAGTAAFLGPHALALREASGSGASSAALSGIFAARQCGTSQMQRCMSASGALTRSSSYGSNLAAAALTASGARICSLPGALTPRSSAATSGHVTRSMSGAVSPALLAAAAALAAAGGSSSDVCHQQLLLAGTPEGGAAVVGGVVPDWLKLPQAPAHLMWRQPQGKMRPLPGHRVHYHSDGGIQEVSWPAPSAPSPAPAAVAAAVAAAGSSVVSLPQPPAVVVAAVADGGVVCRTASPGLEAMVMPGGAPMAPSGQIEASLLALHTKTIKCSMCGGDVLGIIMRQHGGLCGLLVGELSKIKGPAATADAQLTVLANWIEDQLLHGVWPEILHEPLQRIVQAARLAASLQPDGTRLPEEHCSDAIMALQHISKHWWDQMQTLTVTQSNAEVLAAGAADCDIVVTLCLQVIRRMEAKRQWLSEPLPVQSRRQSMNPSGLSTPRSSAVMQVSDFELISPISRGAYGRVYKVKKRSTGDLFAIKVMTKTDLVRKNMVESVTNERNILAMANNPFVVRFYYSFSSPEKLFLVMEYCQGGDLASMLQDFCRFDEDLARQYIAEVVLALEYVHSKGIIHRDLKPDNLLISSTGHVKLSDFGLSKLGAGGATATAAAAATADAEDAPAAAAGAAGDATSPVTPDLLQQPQAVAGQGAPAAAAAGHGDSALAAPGCFKEVQIMDDPGCRAPVSKPYTLSAFAAEAQDHAAAARAAAEPRLSVEGAFAAGGGSSSLPVQQRQQSMVAAAASESPEVAQGGDCSNRSCSVQAQQQQQQQPAAGSSGLSKAFRWKSLLKGGTDGSMSPGTAQMVRRLTRLIPHTSLPSSPAVFGHGGASGGGCGSSGACSSSGQQSTPNTPAPALHKLAAYHSGMLSGGASSSLGIMSGPDDSFASNPDGPGCGLLPGGPNATSAAAAAAPKAAPISPADVSSILCTGSSSTVAPASATAAAEAGAAGGISNSSLLRAKSSNARSGLSVKWSEDVPEMISPVAAAPADASHSVADAASSDQQQQQDVLARVQQETPAAASTNGRWSPQQQQEPLTAADQSAEVTETQQQQQNQHLGLWRSASDSPAHQKAACSKLQTARVLERSLEQQQQQQEQQQLLRFMSLQPLSSPVNMEHLQIQLQAVADSRRQQEQQYHQQLRQHLLQQQDQLNSGTSSPCKTAGTASFANSQQMPPPCSPAVTTGLESAAAVDVEGSGMSNVLRLESFSDRSNSAALSTAPPSSKLSLQRSLSVSLPPDPSLSDNDELEPSGSNVLEVDDALPPAVLAASATAADGAAVACVTASDHLGSTEATAAAVAGGSGHDACGAGANHGSEDAPARLRVPRQKLKRASQVCNSRALGTPDYLAPEMLMGLRYGPEVDWWALGIILYEFMYGAPPFNADSPQKIFENILDQQVEFITDDDGNHYISDECRDLISRLLEGDPEKRLGHRGAGEVKLHPWFKGIEWSNLARQKAAFVPSSQDMLFVRKPFNKHSIAADLTPAALPDANPLSSSNSRRSTAGGAGVPGSNPAGSVGGGSAAPSLAFSPGLLSPCSNISQSSNTLLDYACAPTPPPSAVAGAGAACFGVAPMLAESSAQGFVFLPAAAAAAAAGGSSSADSSTASGVTTVQAGQVGHLSGADSALQQQQQQQDGDILSEASNAVVAAAVAAAAAAAAADADVDDAAFIAAETAAFGESQHPRLLQQQQQLSVWGSAGGASTPGSSYGGSMQGSMPGYAGSLPGTVQSGGAAKAFLVAQTPQYGNSIGTLSDPLVYQQTQQQQQQAFWDSAAVPNSGVWLPLSKQYAQQQQQQQQQQRVSSSCGGDNSSSFSGYDSLTSSRQDSPVVLPAAAAAAAASAAALQRAHSRVLSPAASLAAAAAAVGAGSSSSAGGGGSGGIPPLPPPALSGPAVAAMRVQALQQQREQQQDRFRSHSEEVGRGPAQQPSPQQQLSQQQQQQQQQQDRAGSFSGELTGGLQQWGSTCPNLSLEAELLAEDAAAVAAAAAAAAAAAGQQQGSPAAAAVGGKGGAEGGEVSPQQQQQQQRNPRRKSKGSSPQQRLKHQWAQHMQQLQQKQQDAAAGGGSGGVFEDEGIEADNEQQPRIERRPRRSRTNLQSAGAGFEGDEWGGSDESLARDPSSCQQQKQLLLCFDPTSPPGSKQGSTAGSTCSTASQKAGLAAAAAAAAGMLQQQQQLAVHHVHQEQQGQYHDNTVSSGGGSWPLLHEPQPRLSADVHDGTDSAESLPYAGKLAADCARLPRASLDVAPVSEGGRTQQQQQQQRQGSNLAHAYSSGAAAAVPEQAAGSQQAVQLQVPAAVQPAVQAGRTGSSITSVLASKVTSMELPGAGLALCGPGVDSALQLQQQHQQQERDGACTAHVNAAGVVLSVGTDGSTVPQQQQQQQGVRRWLMFKRPLGFGSKGLAGLTAKRSRQCSGVAAAQLTQQDCTAAAATVEQQVQEEQLRQWRLQQGYPASSFPAGNAGVGEDSKHAQHASAPGCLQGAAATAAAAAAEGVSLSGHSSSSNSNTQPMRRWDHVMLWVKQQKGKARQRRQQQQHVAKADAVHSQQQLEQAASSSGAQLQAVQQQQQCQVHGQPAAATAAVGPFAAAVNQQAAEAAGSAAAEVPTVPPGPRLSMDGASGSLAEVASLAPTEAQQPRVNSLDLEAEAAFADFATVNVEALQELNREKQQQEVLEPIAQAVTHVNLAAAAAAEQQFQLLLSAGYTGAGSSSGGGGGAAAAALQASWPPGLPVTGMQQQWFQQLQQQQQQQQQQYQAFLAQQQQSSGPASAPGLQCYSGSLHSMAEVVAAAAAGSLQDTSVPITFSPGGLLFSSGPSRENLGDMGAFPRQESPTGFVSEPVGLMHMQSMQQHEHTAQLRQQQRLARLSSSSLDKGTTQQQQQQYDSYSGNIPGYTPEDAFDDTCGYWGDEPAGSSGGFSSTRSPLKSTANSLLQRQGTAAAAAAEPESCFAGAAAAQAAAAAAGQGAGAQQVLQECKSSVCSPASGVTAAASATASPAAGCAATAAAGGGGQGTVFDASVPALQGSPQPSQQQASPVLARTGSVRMHGSTLGDTLGVDGMAAAASAAGSSNRLLQRTSYSIDAAAPAAAAAGDSPSGRISHRSSHSLEGAAALSHGASDAFGNQEQYTPCLGLAVAGSGQLQLPLQPASPAVAATQQLWRQPSPSAGNVLLLGALDARGSASSVSSGNAPIRPAIFKRLPRPCMSSSQLDRLQIKQRLSEPGVVCGSVRLGSGAYGPAAGAAAVAGLVVGGVGGGVSVRAGSANSSSGTGGGVGSDQSSLFHRQAATPGSSCSSADGRGAGRRGARRAASSVTWAAAAAAYAANASSVAAVAAATAAAAAAAGQSGTPGSADTRGSVPKPRRLSGSAIPRPGAPEVGPGAVFGSIVESHPGSPTPCEQPGPEAAALPSAAGSRSSSSMGGGLPHVMSMPSLSAFGSGGGSGYPPEAAHWTQPPQQQLWVQQQLQQYQSLAGAGFPVNSGGARLADGGSMLAAGPGTYSEDGSLQGPRFGQYSPCQVRPSYSGVYRSFSTGGGTAPATAAAAAAAGAASPAAHHHHDRRFSMPVTPATAFAAGSEGGRSFSGFTLPSLDVMGVEGLGALGASTDVLRGGLATPRWPHGSLFASPGMGSMTVSDVGAVSPAAMMAAVSLGDKRQFLVQLGAIAKDGSRGYKYRMSDNGGGGGRSFLQRAATCSLPGTLTPASLTQASSTMQPAGGGALSAGDQGSGTAAQLLEGVSQQQQK